MSQFPRRAIRALAVTVVLALGSIASAYIPSSQTIASRVARNHGKGSYIIEQEVQFRTNAEPLILRERWVVENGESMRLSVTSPQTARGSEPIRYDVVYKGGRRTVTDPVGGVKTVAMSPEFLETFFHARSGSTLLSHLVKSQILNASILKERPKAQKLDQVKHVPEPQVRLGRTSGTVAWIFGEPSPIEGKLNPEAWVQQDAFLLLRLRFPSQAEVSAERHSVYAGTLRFPRERTLSWDGNSAKIRVLSVKQVAAAQIGKSLDPASLNTVKSPRLPDVQQVREFYTRFR